MFKQFTEVHCDTCNMKNTSTGNMNDAAKLLRSRKWKINLTYRKAECPRCQGYFFCINCVEYKDESQVYYDETDRCMTCKDEVEHPNPLVAAERKERRDQESKHPSYSVDDFNVILDTGDKRSPYRFTSKDGMIYANVFWEKGNVEIRGMYGETGTIHIGFPLANTGGEKTPSADKFLDALILKVNRGEIDGLE
jgi:hypothetical protein